MEERGMTEIFSVETTLGKFQPRQMEGEIKIELAGTSKNTISGTSKNTIKCLNCFFPRQFSLNADKRNMLEEMTGQLREEVRQ